VIGQPLGSSQLWQQRGRGDAERVGDLLQCRQPDAAGGGLDFGNRGVAEVGEIASRRCDRPLPVRAPRMLRPSAAVKARS
jgi:hypothetical protein